MNKEELLKIAKEKYPIGTVFISDYSLKCGKNKQESIYTITTQEHFWVKNNLQFTSNKMTPYVYYNGK